MLQIAGQPGLPLSLTKPIGTGVLNAWHKATGEVSAAAVEVMTTLNAAASRQALAGAVRLRPRSGRRVSPSWLLFSSARASGVSAVVDHAAVPLIEGARAAAEAGHMPGGSRRNLEWVLPHTDTGVSEEDLLLLADAQTSGGLLVAGELPGAPVIGELIPRLASVLIIR